MFNHSLLFVLIIFTCLTRCVKHVTSVFTIFNHLTNIGVVHDVVIIFISLLNRYEGFGFLNFFEFFDTLSKSSDLIVKIIFSPVIKLIRHLNENTSGEWVFHVFLKNINSRLHLGMEHVRKIMEIMDDEMFPTKREWVYVKICNELKQIHIQLQELTRLKALHAPATIDPSAYIESRTSARVDPSAPSLG